MSKIEIDDPAPERDVIQWVSDTVGLSTDHERELARRLAALRVDRGELMDTAMFAVEALRLAGATCDEEVDRFAAARFRAAARLEKARLSCMPPLAAAPDQADAGKVEPDGPSAGACVDCGRRYGDRYGFPDLVVPHDVWNNHLSPDKDSSGLLCPSCMCRRAHAAGLEGVPATFQSGPFCVAGKVEPAAPAPPDGKQCEQCGYFMNPHICTHCGWVPEKAAPPPADADREARIAEWEASARSEPVKPPGWHSYDYYPLAFCLRSSEINAATALMRGAPDLLAEVSRLTIECDNERRCAEVERGLARSAEERVAKLTRERDEARADIALRNASASGDYKRSSDEWKRCEAHLDAETNGKTWGEIIAMFAKQRDEARAELGRERGGWDAMERSAAWLRSEAVRAAKGLELSIATAEKRRLTIIRDCHEMVADRLLAARPAKGEERTDG